MYVACLGACWNPRQKKTIRPGPPAKTTLQTPLTLACRQRAASTRLSPATLPDRPVSSPRKGSHSASVPHMSAWLMTVQCVVRMATYRHARQTGLQV